MKNELEKARTQFTAWHARTVLKKVVHHRACGWPSTRAVCTMSMEDKSTVCTRFVAYLYVGPAYSADLGVSAQITTTCNRRGVACTFPIGQISTIFLTYF